MRHRLLLLPVLAGLSVSPLSAQTLDSNTINAIRTEGMQRSKIMWIEHMLTDRYGPRPIGSPNHVAAANWAMKAMTDFGLANAHLEPFTWRGVGWFPGPASGYMLEPVKANLKFEANPWSPSTHGTVSGEVISVVAPENPTEAEMNAWLTATAPKLRNAIVMVGVPPAVPVNFCEPQKRIADSVARASYLPRDPNAPAPQRGGRGIGGGGACGGRGGGAGGGRGGAPPAASPDHLTQVEVGSRVAALVRDNLPALRLMYQGGGRIPGEIVAQNGQGQVYDDVTPQPPAVILRNEDAGRIYRLIQDGTPVKVQFNMQNQYFPEGKTSYVTVAEIPGTDKADEVVMLGGHLDSWTSATGATDNAIGCAIMMEATRILKAIGAKPRRTIRVALWSGEEQGLLGSFAYVANHFGSFEQPKPDFTKLDAYWNIDDGTGLVRGAGVFGPPQAADVVAQLLKPFEGFGVYGAAATSARVEGGSDNGAFAVAGLPGIGARQDPIEYNSTTWHSNLDTYERIVPDDVMKNASITAGLVLGLANRDEMLPRFAPDQMPAVPPPGGGRGANVAQRPPLAPLHVYAASKNLPLVVPPGGLLPQAARGAATAPATVTRESAPAHGTVLLREDGGFTYRPRAGFVGVDTFTYRAQGATQPGTVMVVVN